MLTGIHTALVTPFDAELQVDVGALERSVEHQIEAGIAGLCALGGTGEPLSQSLDEHRLVIDTVMAAANGRVPITVGALRAGQSEVIAIARHARSAGAGQVMVVPPYFYGARLHDIQHHLAAVAEAVDVPLVFFHSPGRSGIRLTADEMLQLLEAVPAIQGIKDASGDVIFAAEIMAGAPGPVAFMQGLDELLLPTLALGACGGIVSLAELLPRTLAALARHVAAGDLPAARRLQLGIIPLCRWIYSEPNPGPLKHALALAGRSVGACRPPIYGPRPETAAGLAALLPVLLEGEGS